jgi:hypothetical protein
MSETARTLADDILKAAGSALRHYEAASQERILAVAQKHLDAERDMHAAIARSWGETATKCGQHVEAAIAEDIALCITSRRHPALTQGEEA